MRGVYALEEKTLTDDNTFDLIDDLLERDFPTREVDVWFDLVGGEELDKLERQIEREWKKERPDEKQIDLWKEEFDVKYAEFQDKKYTVHLQGIPIQQKKDIVIRALKLVPVKRDGYGRDDEVQLMKRDIVQKNLVWEAYITKVVNPEGKVQEKPSQKVIEVFTGRAPVQVVNRVDEAIGELDTEVDVQHFGHQDADFLSKP